MYKTIAYIEKDPETEFYIAVVPGDSRCSYPTRTLDELQENLKEVVELCLEEMDSETRRQLPEFVGLQQVEVAV